MENKIFIQMFSILLLGIIIPIVYIKGVGKTLTSDDLLIISLVIMLIWFLLAITFLKKNKIKINEFIGKPSKKRFIFEVTGSNK